MFVYPLLLELDSQSVFNHIVLWSEAPASLLHEQVKLIALSTSRYEDL